MTNQFYIMLFLALVATPLWARPSNESGDNEEKHGNEHKGEGNGHGKGEHGNNGKHTGKGHHSTTTTTTSTTSSTQICHCPMIANNFTQQACGLDWISQAKVTSVKSMNIQGTAINQYTLQHIKTFRGPTNLPTTLIVPSGGCELNLVKQQTYLLSGMIADGSQLMSTSCLSLSGGASPLWNKVSPILKKELQSLDCTNVPTLPTSIPTLPNGLPTIPMSTTTTTTRP